MAARQAERRPSLQVNLGVTYDDNVSVRPTTNKREPQVAELRTHRHESAGELFGVRADSCGGRARTGSPRSATPSSRRT